MKTATRLGHYTILRKIGEGAMGSVYEAVQDGLNRRVALKVISERLASDPTYLERFRREAEAAAALNHPNIVTVYEIGQEQGTHFFTMQFVDGESLQERVERLGRLPAAEAVLVVAAVAEALDYAWNHGRIIHRDIKPDNIMITREGKVLLADLGLAKSVEEEARITMTGVPIGSPAFMAPEQAESARDADCRADIYSLGITFFFMLTGQLPFQGPTALAVILAHGKQPLPDPRSLNPDVPPDVCGVLQRMCAKDPAQRPQTPLELLQELEKTGIPSSLHRQATLPAPTRVRRDSDRFPARRKIILLGAGTALLLVLLVVLAASLFRAREGQTSSPPGGKTTRAAEEATTARPRPDAVPDAGEASLEGVAAEERLKALLEEAVEYARANGEEFESAVRNFREVEEEGRGTKYAMRARNERERVERLWAQDAFRKTQARVEELVKADRFGEAIRVIEELPDARRSLLESDAVPGLRKSLDQQVQDRFEALRAEAKGFTDAENFQNAREVLQRAILFGVPAISQAVAARLKELDDFEAVSRVRQEAAGALDVVFWADVAALAAQRQYDKAVQKCDELAAQEPYNKLGPETFDWYKSFITQAQTVYNAAVPAAAALVDQTFDLEDRGGIARKGTIKKLKNTETLLFLDESGEIGTLFEELSSRQLIQLATPGLLQNAPDQAYIHIAFYWLFEDKTLGRQAIEQAKAAGQDVSWCEYLFPALEEAVQPETPPEEPSAAPAPQGEAPASDPAVQPGNPE